MSKTIAHIVTNLDHYADHPDEPTGLWLSELTHAWDVFEEAGYRQILVSPAGGKVPLEPRSMKFPLLDAQARRWLDNANNRALLDNTLSPSEVSAEDIDAIYFTGGHATMYDFLDNDALHNLTREVFEAKKVVSSVCHGFCGLLNVTLSDGSPLLKGRHITGFSWNEEILAGVSKIVPYNGPEEVKRRGATYSKALIPFTPYVVQDSYLITGQNPFSAKKTAQLVVRALR